MIEFKQIFEHRNRGMLLDVTVFLFQLISIRLLTMLSLGFVNQAEENALAKTAISLFLVGLFVLQPVRNQLPSRHELHPLRHARTTVSYSETPVS
jgi:hypothetical protein